MTDIDSTGIGAADGSTDGDVGLLGPASASPAVMVLTGDRAVLSAILAVESGWAAVLEEAGLAPTGSSAVVASAAEAGRYDVADVAVRAQAGGNPVIPLLADLKRQVEALDTEGLGAVRAVHVSLTSQDVLDTALMLVARNTVQGILTELRGATAALASLAGAHTGTLCVSRTLTRHALPSTFGLRAAQWFHGLAAAGRLLGNVELPVQFGGAGGTLAAGKALTASTASNPFGLADALAGELGLAAAPAPWHTNRLPVTALGGALATVLDAYGKIAADVLFLSRPEIAELAEPRSAGRGVSSAMPQKENPVLSVLIRSAALQGPQLAAQLHLAAANFNDERPDGAWHTEWPALRQLLSLTLGAARSARELVEGLQLFPDAMRRNLEIAGPLLLAEGISGEVGPLLTEKDGLTGRQQLQVLVDRALQQPAEHQGETYRRSLRQAVPTGTLSDERLGELLDPAHYLGEAAEISRRILAAFPDHTSPGTDRKESAHG